MASESHLPPASADLPLLFQLRCLLASLQRQRWPLEAVPSRPRVWQGLVAAAAGLERGATHSRLLQAGRWAGKRVVCGRMAVRDWRGDRKGNSEVASSSTQLRSPPVLGARQPGQMQAGILLASKFGQPPRWQACSVDPAALQTKSPRSHAQAVTPTWVLLLKLLCCVHFYSCERHGGCR